MYANGRAADYGSYLPEFHGLPHSHQFMIRWPRISLRPWYAALLGGLSVLLSMKRGVVGRRHHLQIFWPVVFLVAVYVMYNLIIAQEPTDCLLGNNVSTLDITTFVGTMMLGHVYIPVPTLRFC